MEPLGYRGARPDGPRRAFGRDSSHATYSRDLLERRKGLVRGLSPRTSRVQHRRRHHDVQRGGARSRSHGLRPEIVSAQVERLGLRGLPSAARGTPTTKPSRERSRSAAAMGVTHVIFGDILFDEHREWAERLSVRAGLTAVEPLWKQSTTDLYREFLSSGTRARIVTVRSKQAGRVVPRTRSRRRSARRFRRARRRSVRRARRVSHLVTACPAFDAPAARPRPGPGDP